MWRSIGEHASVWPGRQEPLGATWGAEATNFAVHAPRGSAAWVCLFDDDGRETRHELGEQSLGVWHGAVPGVAPGTAYGFRVDGPWEPDAGLRFNPHKLLLDPYARAVSGELVTDPAIYGHDVDDPERMSELDSAPFVPRGVVVAPDDFDWQGQVPSRQRWRDTVIYELHVKGMTALHDRVPEHLRGTYAGLATPAVIDYLVDLGVSAVELLPVHQFVTEPAVTARGLTNYWGYNTLAYFAPHHAYSASGDRGGQATEFKAMVRAFHAAGIEVFLDVVYNHTAEAGTDGPTLSMRGLDDLGFYTRTGPDVDVLDEPGPAQDQHWDQYWDITGCGNTVDASDPFALRLILDSLRHWVEEFHVDGFRFDLLSALTRVDHAMDMRCHLLTAIGQDPVLRQVKLIAEPWDASSDGYAVGSCPSPWVEWNDQYRDEIRDYWRGATDGVRTVATRLAGSSDLYADDGRSPYASVNFVTAHDGFTVRDLVSYATKHNEANGEDNRDGTDNHRSDRHGVEGETDDEAVRTVRRRVAANLMATLCLSNGVPMIVAGDERGRTQRGNNNAYCQDNEISWVDWRAEGGPGAWLDVHAVTRAALRLRREHPALRQRHWFEGRPTVVGGPKDLVWLHPSGRVLAPDDWHDHSLTTLGMFVSGRPLRSPGPHGEQQVDSSFVLWFHADESVLEVALPRNDWVHEGEVALSTDPALVEGARVRSGETLRLDGPCVVVLRESDTTGP